jgi:hypothetical protein
MTSQEREMEMDADQYAEFVAYQESRREMDRD